MKTIAQQLGIKEFPFVIRGCMGKRIYRENSDGFWFKYEYDSNGNQIYHENSNGFWSKKQYDSNGNVIYFENSKGEIINKRPKQVELSMDEIAAKFGINVSELKIKK
jgi:hypothetical protein